MKTNPLAFLNQLEKANDGNAPNLLLQRLILSEVLGPPLARRSACPAIKLFSPAAQRKARCAKVPAAHQKK